MNSREFKIAKSRRYQKELLKTRISEGYHEATTARMQFEIPELNISQSSELWIFYHQNGKVSLNEVNRHTKNIDARIPLQKEIFTREEFRKYQYENHLIIGAKYPIVDIPNSV